MFWNQQKEKRSLRSGIKQPITLYRSGFISNSLAMFSIPHYLVVLKCFSPLAKVEINMSKHGRNF